MRLAASPGERTCGLASGEVATSRHANPATNLVSIKPGQAIKVPLKMEDDYHGKFEVRAIDPVTGVNHATLKLKTDYVD